jgi:YVTN family beta-propeller protein
MFRTSSFGFVVSLLAVAACGDNVGTVSPDAHGSGDAPMVDAAPLNSTALVVAGDFNMTGTLARINAATNAVEKNLAAGAVDQDPQARLIGTELFVVNRGKNNLTVLDAKTLVVKLQVSTGAGSNPQDVAVAGNKIYVPALGTKGIVVVTRGVTATTTIDLSTLDTDGKPDCNSALVVGTKLFVSCGGLQNFAPTFGKVVVIDTATDTRVATFDLPNINPFGQLVQTPTSSIFAGDVLVSTSPDFADQTKGCVARFSPTAATPTATCAFTNAALGANPSQMVVSADGKSLYLTPQSFTGTAPLRRVDLVTGMLATAPVSGAGQVIADVAACPDGRIIAADQKTGASGIRIFTAAGEQTTTPLDIGIKPLGGGALSCF